MIKTLTDVPDNVIAFEAEGEIRAEDYTTTLLPAVDAQLAAHDEVRIVLVFPEFAGYSGGAAWEDLKVGTEHLTKWKRIALVTDVEWMIHLVKLFGWMTPGEVKLFAMADRAAAITWAAG